MSLKNTLKDLMITLRFNISYLCWICENINHIYCC